MLKQTVCSRLIHNPIATLFMKSVNKEQLIGDKQVRRTKYSCHSDNGGNFGVWLHKCVSGNIDHLEESKLCIFVRCFCSVPIYCICAEDWHNGYRRWNIFYLFAVVLLLWRLIYASWFGTYSVSILCLLSVSYAVLQCCRCSLLIVTVITV